MSPAVSEVSICIASAAVLARAHSASVKLGGAASSGCLSCWKMWFNRHIGEFCNHIRSVLENTLHNFFAFVKPFLITFHGIFCWIRLGLGKFLQVMDQVGTGKFVSRCHYGIGKSLSPPGHSKCKHRSYPANSVRIDEVKNQGSVRR